MELSPLNCVSSGVTVAASEQVNEVLLLRCQIDSTHHAMDGVHSSHRPPAWVTCHDVGRTISVSRGVVY